MSSERPGTSSVEEADVADTEEPDQLTSEEEDDLMEAESEIESVVYSGQDFDVNGLIRRMRNEDILIPTFGHDDDRIISAGFQRSFVWRKPQMDRFIESILLGYPIPGIFLIKQSDKRYLVLDGQQRLSTLKYFEGGLYESREFKLKNVSDQFKGLTYKELPSTLRRSFDDTFIQATIVSSDGSVESLDSIYKIFERLNSGGTQLTAHEIRVALFAGPLIDYIEDLNKTESWRNIYGRRSKRLRDQELVLRIIALYVSSTTYKKPLKSFLNSFVSKYRHLNDLDFEFIRNQFVTASHLIAEGPGANALRPQGRQVNAALTEAMFVGLLRRLDEADMPSIEAVTNATNKLKSDEKLLRAVSRSTADEEQLNKRLEISTSYLAGI
ncbi:MAG: DUF262 domain-containing protein [Acidimicrobiia bacterium]|nr:DUF262 domain-containing protein [Acidimicrobiia bacterium]